MINPLKNYKILIVDADVEIAQVVSYVLNEMGFSNVQSTNNGKDALSLIQSTQFDFIITEWHAQQMDGIGLVDFIRRDPQSVNPNIPVIMLTSRTEAADIAFARDHGVTEFINKPFTAKSIYTRLERIFENPRAFLITQNFTGHDRRSGANKPENIPERRSNKIAPTQRPKQKSQIKELLENAKNSPEPKIWIPDLSLKIKLGKNTKLEDLITFDVINKAQEAINSIQDDAILWVHDNVRELRTCYNSLIAQSPPLTIKGDICNLSLAINSRAGTFGYQRASEISYMLYLFSQNKLKPENTRHHIIVEKHLQTLQTIINNKLSGDADEIGALVAENLKKLTSKYSE